LTAGEDLAYDVADPAFSIDVAVAQWRTTGVIVLRNLFAGDLVDALVSATDKRLEFPNISGSAGYFKPDHPKKFVDPFLVGGAAVDIALDERLTDIVERYMGAETVLSEATIKQDSPTPYKYFGVHSDYSVGTRRHTDSGLVVTEEMMAMPLGVGAALYFHDCYEGAFSYCLESHLLGAPHGQDLADYPESERKRILATWRRFAGKKGDLVIFDDRGFHGPAQPARSSRLVMLLDWMNTEVWGGRYPVRPFPILTSDIGRLSARQLRTAGVGAEPMTTLDRYHLYGSFGARRPLAHRLAAFIVNNAFLLDDIKARARAALRRS